MDEEEKGVGLVVEGLREERTDEPIQRVVDGWWRRRRRREGRKTGGSAFSRFPDIPTGPVIYA